MNITSVGDSVLISVLASGPSFGCLGTIFTVLLSCTCPDEDVFSSSYFTLSSFIGKIFLLCDLVSFQVKTLNMLALGVGHYCCHSPVSCCSSSAGGAGATSDSIMISAKVGSITFVLGGHRCFLSTACIAGHCRPPTAFQSILCRSIFVPRGFMNFGLNVPCCL